MIYLSGVRRPDRRPTPMLLTPQVRYHVLGGMPWAADNGRFAAPHKYTDEKYLAWLGRRSPERCLFATAPDVVGDARATLLLSAPMLPAIRRAGYRAAFVAQDGQENLPVPWDELDALFVGGTTVWKLSPAAAALVGEARARGKWAHMGRVNSGRRLRYAHSIGCQSADGTILKHDPARDTDSWVRHIWQNPSLWWG